MNPFQKLSKDAPEKLKQIEKWSAGCQEFAIRVHIEEAMTILEKFKASTGNKFYYTPYTRYYK